MKQISSISRNCTICGSVDITDLITITDIPVHCNLLWSTKDGAIGAPRGDIHLGFCQNCSHIFNMTFDPQLMEYTLEYENSLHFSPRFQQYARELAERLVEQHDLHDKDIVEIGCGQGDFLRLLCELGDNRGTGFDPSYVNGGNVNNNQLTFIRDYYTETYADYPADFICSRHVLEHIQQPNDFVSMIQRIVGDRGNMVIFFEVPNVLYTLHQLGIWDIIYEHCSYFSPYSLATTFTQNSFHVMQTLETFGNQFLALEAAPTNRSESLAYGDPATVEKLAQEANLFADNYKKKVDFYQESLNKFTQQGQKVVIWGAGSKGVTFMNTFKTQDIIEFAVDINPRKSGMHVAGTGQEIVPPESLQQYKPDIIILMNANYQEEIRQTIETLGLSADIILA